MYIYHIQTELRVNKLPFIEKLVLYDHEYRKFKDQCKHNYVLKPNGIHVSM